MLYLKYIYIFVFSSLAGWATFAYFTTTQIIQSQQEYANIINITGKQRMLSQKTALISKRYLETKDENLKVHLRSLYTLMKSDHEIITTKHINSSTIKSLYFEKPKQLDSKVKHYLQLLSNFLEDETSTSLAKFELLSFELLPILNEAVSEFEKESNTKTQLLLERELFILLGTLITLILEAVFIVIPAIRYATHHENELNKLVKERTKELEELSITDPLTKLYNRRKIDEMLAYETERAHRNRSSFSVILLDIDKFKDVNDTYGHQVGDAILIQISQLLSNNIRKIDTLGRWGGEEFFIISTEGYGNKAAEFAEKIRSIIEMHDFDEVGKVTCSFGVTHYIEGDTQDSILQRCDKALYKAKNSGRNCVNEIIV